MEGFAKLEQEPQKTFTGTPLKILVVDDVKPMRYLLRTTLEKSGYDVSEAETAWQAYNHLKSKHVDLVILDMGLPDIHGMDLLKHLRSEPGMKRIPIIVCTAQVEKSIVIKAAKLGINDFIPKPVNIQILLERIEKIFKPETDENEDSVPS